MKIIDYGFVKQHNPKSVELFEFISTLDFENGDYFCFKSGGDGDNGEIYNVANEKTYCSIYQLLLLQGK